MLVLLGLLLVEAALAEPRTALVIGNAAYTDSPLANPVNDARDIAKALQGMGFTVTLRENLQKRAMEEVIGEFSRRLQQQRGVGLFFYSGHGAQINGRNYLIPVGTAIHSEADVVYEAVDAGRLLDHMEEAGNSLNVVILDACRNNPFGRGFQSTRGGGLTRGLAQMDAPAGSIIAYSTAPGRVAEDGSGRNSPYTSALLAVMGTPGLGIEQVFKQVRNRVIQATGNKQVPWESTSLMGDFYFVTVQIAPPPAEVSKPASVSSLSPLVVPQTSPMTETLTLGADIFFDYNIPHLKPAGLAKLDELAMKLRSMGSRVKVVGVVGYTDSSEAYTQKLSEQRAKNVVDYFIQQGVNPNIIEARGMGANNPIASNATAAGRAQNRRVEITVDTAGSFTQP